MLSTTGRQTKQTVVLTELVKKLNVNMLQRGEKTLIRWGCSKIWENVGEPGMRCLAQNLEELGFGFVFYSTSPRIPKPVALYPAFFCPQGMCAIELELHLAECNCSVLYITHSVLPVQQLDVCSHFQLNAVRISLQPASSKWRGQGKRGKARPPQTLTSPLCFCSLNLGRTGVSKKKENSTEDLG